jgi:hypothetical protein
MAGQSPRPHRAAPAPRPLPVPVPVPVPVPRASPVACPRVERLMRRLLASGVAYQAASVVSGLLALVTIPLYIQPESASHRLSMTLWYHSHAVR